MKITRLVWFFVAAVCVDLICVKMTMAQSTVVFSDDFNRSSLSPGGTPAMTYTTSVVNGDGGADIDATSNFLLLTNDSSATANIIGSVSAVGSTASFGAPYNSILANNTNQLIEWDFNAKTNRTTNLSGFLQSGGGNYGMAI